MKSFLTLNIQTFIACCGRIWETPLPTLFTAGSVGVILSLPVGLYILSDNLIVVKDHIYSAPELTIFIDTDADEQAVQELHETVRSIPEVGSSQIILADFALEEFKEITGIEAILEYVSENPLPHVITVQPKEEHLNPASFTSLQEKIEEFELVDSVQIDFEWIQRLHSIIVLSRLVFSIISVLLILATVLLICNTTRLSIANRIEEIMVIDQIGGTSSFIRKPFVYMAVIQSLLGVMIAWIILESTRLTLAEPIRNLSSLYSSDFQISGLSWDTWLVIAIAAASLNWIASRITVSVCLRHLSPHKVTRTG